MSDKDPDYVESLYSYNQKIATKCRICGNEELVPIISLGNQCLTSVFPSPDSDNPSLSPLDLLFCSSKTKEVCNLVQLKHNADIEEMYGSTYWYFSLFSVDEKNLQGKFSGQREMGEERLL